MEIIKWSYYQASDRRRVQLPLLAVLVWQFTNLSAMALNPASFTSLGANPFTVTGTYTINSAANPPVLTRPGLSSINGVISGGEAVFTFDSIAISNGVIIQGARNAGSLPVALLSKSSMSIVTSSEIDFSGANGVSGDFVDNNGAMENGGAAGPGAGGGGGGGGDDNNLNGNGGAGSPSGGNSFATGGDQSPFGPGSGGSVSAGGGGDGGGGGGAFGGSGGTGGNFNTGPGGNTYGNLGVNTGGTNYGTTLQGGSGGGGGAYGSGGGGGGGGGAVEIGAIGSIDLAGYVYTFGGGGGDQAGGGGAGGGVYVHGSSVSLTGGIGAWGGNGGDIYGGGGGGGRVFIFTTTGVFGGSLGNVNVSGGHGSPNNGLTGTVTLAASLVSLTINLTNAIGVLIDGADYYKTPFTNSWSFTTNVMAGTSHTISAFNNGITDGNYAYWYFSSWSDGGAISHTVIPTNNLALTLYYNLLALDNSFNLFQVSNVISSVSSAGALTILFDPPVPVPGLSYSLYASTNLLQSFYLWTYAGHATSTNGTRYQFTDPQATNFPVRFYHVHSP